ncbi:hypothetical protein M527_11950 [Sphingobium indicum IP26]|uniref:Uncharacterized protein n=1 Tax=Sphingobium indicum F2 TaxID=1450518 RepID=A0A8E1C2E9_9SPHN|nr:hypothetical protein M527_11950 [Sphingobium indicum IP26]EQA97786.1 hypothetical protein L286_21675 [Sphingobium sp. HDIP04]KER35931.1 hypothetical protein AL00_13330 [Sphingobium indicum F2]
MLHDIAVRPFAEQPAGKIAPPFIVGGAAHVQLHEGAGFLHIFPGRRGFAGLQPNDGVAHAQRFAGFHRQVGGDAVALVEQADHRHALVHRRARKGGFIAIADLLPLYADGAALVLRRQVVAAATGQDQRAAEDRQETSRRAPRHDASGLHAS